MSAPLYPVAILGGGRATRLRPLSDGIPKALVDVNGEPFIAHQLRLLRSNGLTRVVYCAGYRGEMIREYVADGARFGLHVDYSFDGPVPLGTAGAIRRAVPLLGEAFFVLYGDSYLPCDYRAVQREFDRSGKPALMTVFRNENRWDQSNVEFSEGRLLAYDKTRRTARMRHLDYGLGVFARRAFDGVPDGTATDLATLYRALLERGELAAWEVGQRFYEVGSFEGLEEIRRYLASHPPLPLPAAEGSRGGSSR
jgi:NDP-sugar pyrophosphorylase family protein